MKIDCYHACFLPFIKLDGVMPGKLCLCVDSLFLYFFVFAWLHRTGHEPSGAIFLPFISLTLNATSIIRKSIK